MPENTVKERVAFRIYDGEVTAIFVDELYNERLYGNTMLMCYAHLGQHSGCSSSILVDWDTATVEQYTDLLVELGVIGYEVQVVES